MVRRVKATIGDTFKYTMAWLYVRADELDRAALKFSPKLRNKDEISFSIAKEDAPALYRKMAHMFDAVCRGIVMPAPLPVREERPQPKKVRFAQVAELHPIEINNMITVDNLSKVSIDVGLHNKERVATSVDAILALARE